MGICIFTLISKKNTIMTTNTPVLLKAWMNALFQAIAFCLLGPVGVGIAYAQGLADHAPSAETDTGTTPSHKIAFAKVTGTVGDFDKTEKTAGCVIVWFTSEPSTKHIYCRYELGKNTNFLRDDVAGINLSDIKLYRSGNQNNFKPKIHVWFKNKPKLNLAHNELQLIAELMSSIEERFSPNSLFAIQPPARYEFVLPYNLLASDNRNAEEKRLEDYKTFAAEVHRFLPEKMAEIAQNQKATTTTKQVAPNQVTAADDKADKVDKATGEADDKADNKTEAEETTATKKDEKATPPTDNKLIKPEKAMIWLGLGIILVVIVILAALLWFFLAKKNTHLATELRNEISALDKKISQLQTQWQQPISAQGPSEQESESTPPPKQPEIKAQLESSQRIQELEQEKNRLEHTLKAAQNQLTSEQEQRENTDKALKDIRTELYRVVNSPLSEDAETTLEGLKTLINQYHDAKTQREQADKALKNIRTELNKVVKPKLVEDEDAENTLESIQRGVLNVIRNLRTKEAELKTLTQQYETEKTALAEAQNELKTLYQQYETEKTALAEANNELKTLTENKQTLQKVLHGRFRLVKPEGTDFSDWTTALIEQQATWRWAQPALLAELLACEIHVKQIKEQGDEKAQNILALLELDKPLKQWNTLVGHLFESDTQLWQVLRSTDSGKWLNRLLRASDLLQTYFKQEPQFSLLSMHLSNVAGILQAICAELGVQLIKPQLLEKVPDDIPENYCRYTPAPGLKTLVKPQVLEKFQTMSKFIVDIDTYGFVTADNPKPNVRVFVATLAEWE
jgi:hypothetical protein